MSPVPGHCRSGVPCALMCLPKAPAPRPPLVYSFMDERRNIATINLIQKPCDGLGVSLTEFFDEDELIEALRLFHTQR